MKLTAEKRDLVKTAAEEAKEDKSKRFNGQRCRKSTPLCVRGPAIKTQQHRATPSTANNSHREWSTQNELNFIDQLGSHSKSRFSRKQLLESYLRAAKLRKDWGKLDKVVCINHARKCLSNCK